VRSRFKLLRAEDLAVVGGGSLLEEEVTGGVFSPILTVLPPF
jgi:hypothetical protein